MSVVKIGNVDRKFSTIALANIQKMDLKYPNESNDAKKMKSYNWFKEPRFYIIGLIYMLSRLIGVITAAYIVYYVEFTLLLGKENNATIPLVMYISAFIMCIIFRTVKQRCSIKLIYCFFCVFGIGKKVICSIFSVINGMLVILRFCDQIRNHID